VRCEILISVTMKTTVFWNFMPMCWWKCTDVSELLATARHAAKRPGSSSYWYYTPSHPSR